MNVIVKPDSNVAIASLRVAAVAACLLAFALPAHAQQASPFSVGVFGGAQSVENVGAQAGADLSFKQSSRVTFFVEAAWLQDVVSRRRLGTAETVAAHVAQAQGQAVTASLDIPAWTFTAGAKLFLTSSETGVRPYVVVQGGAARITLRPEFTIGGTDVTASLDQYGVTLGEDLTGSRMTPAYGGGFGIAVDRGDWTVDAGLRVLSIRTDGQSANVLRIAVGLGRGF